MDIIIEIAVTIGVCFVATLAFQFFNYLRAREEKKYKGEKFVRTRMPKAVRWFFFGFAVAVVILLIVCDVMLIIQKEPLSTVLIASGVCALFIFLGVLGFCITTFNYEIVDGDSIIIVRCFGKRRKISFDEVKYYSFTPGFIGGLIGYNESGIPLVQSGGVNIGIEEFAGEFKKRDITFIENVKNLPSVLPYEQRDVYAAYKKRKSAKISAWIFFGIGVMMAGMFGMVLGINSSLIKEYENYPVTGIVESYSFGNKTLNIKLRDDEKAYYINNVIYDGLDRNIETQLKEGEEITLYIAYTDSRDRLNISGIEYNGSVFLETASAVKAEEDNYHLGEITGYVFLGLAGASFIVSAVFFIILAGCPRRRVS